MISYLYSVKDLVTGKFSAPFLADSDAAAVRCFSDMLHHQLADLPRDRFNDYDLFVLGSFNDSSGQITDGLSDVPTMISRGGNFIV